MSQNVLAILLGWLVALAIFFGFIILLRYINHRERMAMIQHGMNPHSGTRKPHRSRGILRAGLITMMVGLSLTIGLYPIGFFVPASIASPYHFGPWLLPGLIPLGVGIALVVSYYLEQSSQSVNEESKVIPIEDHRDRREQS